jgi:hypothetical protein
MRGSSELTKINIKRNNVKTQKLSIGTLEKRSNNKKSKFPSRLELSKIKNFLVDYNLFSKDYNEYNATKRLI